MSTETEKIIAFQGDAMLLNWAESNTRGRTVTFLLDNEAESHPFRDFTVKSGKKAGQRFAMVLVQLDDDEQPVVKTPSQIAYLWCKDQQFWHFLNERSFMSIASEDEARAFVCETCKVKSRGDIDKQHHARALWEAMIAGPYQKHRMEIERKQFHG